MIQPSKVDGTVKIYYNIENDHLKDVRNTDTGKYTFARPVYFDLDQIFDCGQCFRFDRNADGGYNGIAFGMPVTITQGEKTVTVFGADSNSFQHVWRDFFALNDDYSGIRDDISLRFGNDETIRSAMTAGQGIRILHQDPWETVCSFIISQNNNIPRIKKIISAMSERFGEKKVFCGKDYYTFPTPEALANAGEEEIFSLRTGFRAAYIYDAAKKVTDGTLQLETLRNLPTDEVISKLMTVKGIGPKVAACAALFGFGKTDAFPVDVWMKKVMAKYYPSGLDIPSLGRYAGIAQQYLFYYERYQVEKRA